MTSFNRSFSQRGRRQDSRRSLRQTRMRSRVSGAAPLMDGLDWSGLPREQLPEDPEHLPYNEVVRKVSRRRKIILHTRPQQLSTQQLSAQQLSAQQLSSQQLSQQLSSQQPRSRSQSGLPRRPKIILHVRRPESPESQSSELPTLEIPEFKNLQLGDWTRYHPGNSAAEILMSLHQAAAVWNSMGAALHLNNTHVKTEY